MEKKRRQHYVWRYYLTAWENQKGKLFCLRNNNLYPASSKDVANIRDFYRLKELNPFDVKLITALFINNSPQKIQEINKSWIEQFNRIFEMKRFFEKKGLSTEVINTEIDILINNIEEELHSKIEESAMPYLKSLRNGDASFYQDGVGKADFNFFICTQYFRTNMIKNSVIRSVNSSPLPIPPEFDVEKIWNVSSHILATTLGNQMCLPINNFTCLMLRNNTSIPFITGDQPVINTKADYLSGNEVKELEFYYPISPSLALLITQFPPTHETIEVGENEVIKYNNFIFQASEEQVFANENPVLEAFRSADIESKE